MQHYFFFNAMIFTSPKMLFAVTKKNN